MKTIKQLADELGVSKTAVRKYMTPEFRGTYTETRDGNVIFINEDGCKLMAETIKKPQETNGNQLAETPDNPGLQEEIAFLREQLQAKDRQLEAKDRQFEQLQIELAKEREHSREQADKLAQLADQAQQLHAGDIRRFLPAAASEDANGPVEAFQDEEAQEPAPEPAEPQKVVLEVVKGLTFRQKVKLLFRKENGHGNHR